MAGDNHYDKTDDQGRPAAPPKPFTATHSVKTTGNGYGWWIAGCLGFLFLCFVLLVGLGVGGYWWYTQQIEKYTDAEPAPIPAVEMSEEEIAELQQKVDSFVSQAMPPSGAGKAASSDKAVENEDQPPSMELVLTADQINALLQSNEAFANRAFIEIEDATILAQVSIPTDQIPGGGGRHFNADAEIEVSLEDGVLLIQIVDAKVKGEELPQEFMTELSKQNLAKELYENPDTAKVIHRFESIEVVDGTVRMRLKRQKTNESSAPQSSEEADAIKADEVPIEAEQVPAEVEAVPAG